MRCPFLCLPFHTFMEKRPYRIKSSGSKLFPNKCGLFYKAEKSRFLYYNRGKTEFEEAYENEPEISFYCRVASCGNSCFLYRIYTLSRIVWDGPGIGTGTG